MPTERQIQETIARCVSTIVYYHDRERSGASDDRMLAELQLLAAFVDELGLRLDAAERLVVLPVESELISRYGPELGGRLVRAFVGGLDVRNHGLCTPAD